ncbi:hypothetical protein E6L37_09715 [Enterococcus lactis]|uniref:Uncharacterized protein n=1 Tax=Enterococcus faecium TaxID=1352 RepID=A0AAI8PXZ6_ENTFC|nr:hypothetical protein D9Z05_04555 [Enterococcus faecium]RDG09761.1 hypothetical protein DQM25_04190 [Enterococcus faecium]RRG15169.1 hypothetical protein CQ403_11800 [Enterococcus faecium]TKA99544.1 hypothetical protein E6L37_09715 [Enterococcus lactis]
MFLSYFNKLKTFFILPEKAESNELTASDRSAFSLLSLTLEAKRLKNNLIPPHQISFVPQSSGLLGHPHTALVHLGSEIS